MKRFALSAVLGALLVAAPATAQLSIYGGGGVALPSGSDLDGVESGWQLAGGLVLDLNERLGIYGEGQFGSHDLESTDVVSVKPSALMAGLIFGLSGNEDAAISPYIFGGGGVQTVKFDGSEGGDSDDSTFGWQAGAGIGFETFLPTFVEARYQSASFDDDSDLSGLDFAIFSILVGFSIDFGGS